MAEWISTGLHDHAASVSSLLTRSLLLVEDDAPLRQRPAQALAIRGFEVATANSAREGLSQVVRHAPAFAVVDLHLGDGNGLDIVAALKQRRPDVRAVIVTAYGNIASAVSAVKIGAVDYLAKPVDADDVVAVLLAQEGSKADAPKHPMSASRVRWEHIQYVYTLCDGNVSQTARQLQMHRRTLQRIIHRQAPQ
jgi:two-component system response regulator RegA